MSDQHDALARLIAPFEVAEFLSRHWAQRTLVVKGRPGKFSHVYDEAAWRSNRAGEASATFIDPRDERKRTQVFDIDPAQVVSCFDAGMLTTNYRLEEHDPRVAAVFNGILASVGLPVPPRRARYNGANVFASHSGGGLPAHFDGTNIFILQISGAKRWRVGREPGVVDPWSVSGDMELEAPDLSGELDVTLEDGDLLYMPPGVWHETHAVGASISVSLDFPQRGVLSLLLDVVRGSLERDLPWRAAFPSVAPDEPGIPERMSELLAARRDELAEAIRKIDTRALALTWAREAAAAVGPWRTPRGEPPVITPETRLARATPRPLRFGVGPERRGSDEDVIYVFFGQPTEVRVTLPLEGIGFVTELARRARFTAGEATRWGGEHDWETVQDLLAGLVVQGALIVDA